MRRLPESLRDTPAPTVGTGKGPIVGIYYAVVFFVRSHGSYFFARPLNAFRSTGVRVRKSQDAGDESRTLPSDFIMDCRKFGSLDNDDEQ
jgi:hypothetical protein